MTKQEWLDEELFVDVYGREYNLSDVPLTYMSRQEAFLKRGTTKLLPGEELTAVIKAERVRRKTSQQRKNLEFEILKMRMKVIAEEWKLLFQQKIS